MEPITIGWTVQLTWILGYAFSSALGLIYIVIRFAKAEWRIEQAEKEIVSLKDKITAVEYWQKNEIEKMQTSINEIKDCFNDLNLSLSVLLAEKGFEVKKKKND